MAAIQRADVNPAVLEWALAEAQHNGMTLDSLRQSFAFLPAWEQGRRNPTYKQLRSFSKSLGIPYGYFVLPSPPDLDDNPIPDFRTLSNQELQKVSWNLRDTINTMKRRQGWLHDYLAHHGAEELGFQGSVAAADDPRETARIIGSALGLEAGWAAGCRDQHEALKEFKDKIEAAGVTVMITGMVGSNTNRTLDVEEFRGFTLADSLAPLIFVNGSDSKTAQLFTLAHELVHVWLGQGGTCLDTAEGTAPSDSRHSEALIERFCNKVAAELLVPRSEMEPAWNRTHTMAANTKSLAKRFKVSQDVIGYRAYDFGLISRGELDGFVQARKQEFGDASRVRTQPGGNYYHNLNYSIGQKFATRVAYAAKAGLISFTDAYDLVGLRGATFKKYANEQLGIKL